MFTAIGTAVNSSRYAAALSGLPDDAMVFNTLNDVSHRTGGKLNEAPPRQVAGAETVYDDD